MRKNLAILTLCVACNASSQGDAGVPPIEASKAESFVAYQEQLIPLLREWVKTSHESKASGKGGKYGGAFAERYDGLREQNGLSEDELQALSEIAAFVAVRDGDMKQRFATEIAEAEKTAVPAGQGETSHEGVDGLRRIQANLLDLQEMRAKYGDAIVVAMLQRESDLKRQHAELAGIQ